MFTYVLAPSLDIEAANFLEADQPEEIDSGIRVRHPDHGVQIFGQFELHLSTLKHGSSADD